MSKTTKSGFTIIELLIVIVIIGILSTVGIVSFSNIQSSTRDSQRSSKITIISEALEKYYSQHGEYPSCNAMSQPTSTVVANTLVGVDPTNLTTPSSTSGTNSFAAPATVSCDPSIITGSTTILTSDVFAYVGNNSDTCLKTSGQTAACLMYTLKYREESTGNTISLVSRHTIPTLATPSAPTTTVTLNGSNILATITPVSCPVGSITQYGIKNRTNGGSWSGYTAWDTITNATQTANQGVKYEYQSQARCYPDGTATSASNPAVGAISNYIVSPITTIPTVPGVSANTVGSNTTWSWPASTGCASGTVVNYQYDYLIGGVSQAPAGWKTPNDPTALSISFTTATQALTYTVSVQAKCTNTNADGGWSASGSAGYYRPSYGNAVASDLISGKTATTISGSITGTMPEQGSPILQPGDLIPSGHYTGGSVATPGTGGSSQVFTTPGTYSWTVPSGVTRIMVAFVGGGGGSAACSYPGAGAGGGIIFANVIPGQVIPYTIGSGGAGGIYAADGNGCIYLAGKGSDGTATTVLGFTGGGGGGAIDAISGGAGGVATAPGVFNGFYYIAPGANARYVDGQQGSGLYISTHTNVGASSGGQGGTGGSGPIAGIGGTGANNGTDGGIGGGGGGNWANYLNGHKGGNGAVKFYW